MIKLTTDDVLKRLQEGRPLSLVRVGDGEFIVLNSMAGISELELCNNAVMRRQMGYFPSYNDIKDIRANLISAYENADIIGIPMHKQETNSHWTKIYDYLDKYAPNRKTSVQYCSIDVAYEFLPLFYYDELMKGKNILNYISCRDLDEQFTKRWNLKQCNKFQIAPEAKFTSGYTGPVHYPDQYNKVQRWMDVVNPKGSENKILFVGAGVIGKIYCNWWRDRGGIAFDIGAAFDEFAGLVTRGPDRGLDVKEVTKYTL